MDLLFVSVLGVVCTRGQWMPSNSECYGKDTGECQAQTTEISTPDSDAYITHLCLNHGSNGSNEINAIESVWWSDGSSNDTVIGGTGKTGSTSECTPILSVGECLNLIYVSYGGRIDALRFFTNHGDSIPSSGVYGGDGSTRVTVSGDVNACLSKLKVRAGTSSANGVSIHQIAFHFQLTTLPTLTRGEWSPSNIECYGGPSETQFKSPCQPETAQVAASDSDSHITQICLNHGGAVNEINAIESVLWSDGSWYSTVVGDISKAGSISECTRTLAVGECISSVYVSYAGRIEALRFFTNDAGSIPATSLYGGVAENYLNASGNADACLSKLKVEPGTSSENDVSIYQIAFYFQATLAPTRSPTQDPSPAPTTADPTRHPTTASPTTKQPTASPTTRSPTSTTPTTSAPSSTPTANPSVSPTTEPTTSDPTATHPSTQSPTKPDNNNTVTVTIRTESLSSEEILSAIANAHNLRSTPLTFTTLSTNDTDAGFATVELLVAVPLDVELDYDVIKATLIEAMVDKYGDEIEVDIDVHDADDGGEKTQEQSATDLGWLVNVALCIASVCFCFAVAGVIKCILPKRRQHDIDHQKQLQAAQIELAERPRPLPAAVVMPNAYGLEDPDVNPGAGARGEPDQPVVARSNGVSILSNRPEGLPRAPIIAQQQNRQELKPTHECMPFDVEQDPVVVGDDETAGNV